MEKQPHPFEDDDEVLSRSRSLQDSANRIVNDMVERDNLPPQQLKMLISFLAASRIFARAISAYESASESYHNYGKLRNIYGRNRKLRVVRWTAECLAHEVIQDVGRNRTWVKEGMPSSAKLVGVALEECFLPFESHFCIVVEDESFTPLDWEEDIPELNIINIDVKRSVEQERSMEREDRDDDKRHHA